MRLQIQQTGYSFTEEFPDFVLKFNNDKKTIGIEFPFKDFTIGGQQIIQKDCSGYSIHLFKKRTGVDERDFFQVYSENEKFSFGFLFPILFFDNPSDFIQNILEINDSSDLETELQNWKAARGLEKTKFIIYTEVLYPAFRLLLEPGVSKEFEIRSQSRRIQNHGFL